MKTKTNKGKWKYQTVDGEDIEYFKTREDAIFHAMCHCGFGILKVEDY